MFAAMLHKPSEMLCTMRSNPSSPVHHRTSPSTPRNHPQGTSLLETLTENSQGMASCCYSSAKLKIEIKSTDSIKRPKNGGYLTALLDLQELWLCPAVKLPSPLRSDE